jgi:uncharacterized protein
LGWMKNKSFIIIALIFILLLFVALILTPLYKKAPVKKVPVAGGRIAIVIDDWGYHLNNLAIVQEIKQPITCAVLPNLKNSGLVAGELNRLGFEIILHLPMEPKERYRLENNTITAKMNAEGIRNIFEKDLASVIFAKGVSNHMGSRITEDEKVSTLVMAEAKKRNLYFLDSFVTAKSVCRKIARKIKIRFAKRDVFLDNQDNPEYIRRQVLELKNLSRKQGMAIGIGHDRKNTLMVLKEMLGALEGEGYKFVFVSELAK